MPNVSLQGVLLRTKDHDQRQTPINRAAEILATLTVPLYQGGAEYAAIRQARQQEQQARKLVDDARRTAVQQVIQRLGNLQRRQGHHRKHARPGALQPDRAGGTCSARRSSAAAPRSTC